MAKHQVIMDSEDVLKHGDFSKAFEKVVELILKIQREQQTAIADLQKTYKLLLDNLTSKHDFSLSELKGKHDYNLSELKGKANDYFVNEKTNKMMREHEQRMSEMMDKMLEVDERMSKVKDGKPGKDIVLPPTLVNDVAYLIEKDKKGEPAKPERFLGGVLQTGVRFETPLGTINGINTVFTVFNVPKYVIGDGITYFEDNGYTLSGAASGKTVTMEVAPTGFIRSAF